MTYKIGLDCDGVIYHYDRTARYMLRRRIEDRGQEVPWELHEPSVAWHAVEQVVSAEDWDWLYTGGVEAGLFRYGHVVGGAIEGIQALNELGDVILVTSRPKQAVHDTIVWLATFTDKAPLSGINILSHGQKKSEVRPLPNLYIDDGGHNIEEILTNTPDHVRAILFDQPWNQDFSMNASYENRLRRGRGWRDTVDLVRAAKAGRW